MKSDRESPSVDKFLAAVKVAGANPTDRNAMFNMIRSLGELMEDKDLPEKKRNEILYNKRAIDLIQTTLSRLDSVEAKLDVRSGKDKENTKALLSSLAEYKSQKDAPIDKEYMSLVHEARLVGMRHEVLAMIKTATNIPDPEGKLPNLDSGSKLSVAMKDLSEKMKAVPFNKEAADEAAGKLKKTVKEANKEVEAFEKIAPKPEDLIPRVKDRSEQIKIMNQYGDYLLYKQFHDKYSKAPDKNKALEQLKGELIELRKRSGIVIEKPITTFGGLMNTLLSTRPQVTENPRAERARADTSARRITQSTTKEAAAPVTPKPASPQPSAEGSKATAAQKPQPAPQAPPQGKTWGAADLVQTPAPTKPSPERSGATAAKFSQPPSAPQAPAQGKTWGDYGKQKTAPLAGPPADDKQPQSTEKVVIGRRGPTS